MKNSKKDSTKQLLVSQLGSMLPYHTKVDYRGGIVDLTEQYRSVSLELCRPYLRPMSSMTRDESKELTLYVFSYDDTEYIGDGKWCYENYIYVGDGIYRLNYYEASRAIEWLNEHHFDHRGLIPMGLALEAPEDMYK